MTQGAAKEPVRLWLVRHARAGAYADGAALTPEGLRQMRCVAGRVRALEPGPAAVFCSDKLRAVQTAEILGTAFGLPPRVDEALGGAVFSGPWVLRTLLGAGVPVVCVGHEPDMSAVLCWFTGIDRPFNKGTAACVVFDSAPGEGRGALRHWIDPDAVCADSPPR